MGCAKAADVVLTPRLPAGEGIDASVAPRRTAGPAPDPETARGEIRTPAFMPVGTAGTVKALTVDQVRAAGADIILGNTYHLMLRPTAERVARLGGLHRFMRWDAADPDRLRRLPGDVPVEDHRRSPRRR